MCLLSPISDESAQDLHSMALMSNTEIVAAGQQDKVLSVNIVRGVVTRKVCIASMADVRSIEAMP